MSTGQNVLAQAGDAGRFDTEDGRPLASTLWCMSLVRRSLGQNGPDGLLSAPERILRRATRAAMPRIRTDEPITGSRTAKAP
eukprot:3193623-Prymnesium_polylepis.1